jgi:hypothetical protein
MDSHSLNKQAMTSSKEKYYLSAWDVNAAMRDIYDVAERAMLPYVLLGDAAKQLVDGVDGFNGNDLQVDKLEWGIPQRNLTPEIKSLFLVWRFESWDDKGFKYEFQGVPVYVHIFTRKYKFFDLPDMKFYGPDFFKIPNPFKTYWPMRHMIK